MVTENSSLLGTHARQLPAHFFSTPNTALYPELLTHFIDIYCVYMYHYTKHTQVSAWEALLLKQPQVCGSQYTRPRQNLSTCQCTLRPARAAVCLCVLYSNTSPGRFGLYSSGSRAQLCPHNGFGAHRSSLRPRRQDVLFTCDRSFVLHSKTHSLSLSLALSTCMRIPTLLSDRTNPTFRPRGPFAGILADLKGRLSCYSVQYVSSSCSSSRRFLDAWL